MNKSNNKFGIVIFLISAIFLLIYFILNNNQKPIIYTKAIKNDIYTMFNEIDNLILKEGIGSDNIVVVYYILNIMNKEIQEAHIVLCDIINNRFFNIDVHNNLNSILNLNINFPEQKEFLGQFYEKYLKWEKLKSVYKLIELDDQLNYKDKKYLFQYYSSPTIDRMVIHKKNLFYYIGENSYSCIYNTGNNTFENFYMIEIAIKTNSDINVDYYEPLINIIIPDLQN